MGARETARAAGRIYKAAAYVRLSREDGDKEESNSITGQKELIRLFLRDKPDIRACVERVDDGYSGATFQRPGFQRMLEEIRAGEIDCVVVKDLSRFGRNYIEAGRYIEQLFPLLGVRFIAINDNYDSLSRQGMEDSILLPFKNLINDAYCRDISVKVRSQLAVKREKGEFIGAFAAYGYLKDPADKNRLVPDEYAAGVVRRIFRWKLDGLSQQGIARRLDDAGICPPAQYKRAMGTGYRTPFSTSAHEKWSAVAVGRILQNPLYIGTVEQGKSSSPNFRVRRREKPRDQWTRVENCCEPLVSRREFEMVQRLLLADTRVAPSGEAVYPLSGLLACADCGQGMVRRAAGAAGKRYAYYICAGYKLEKSCTSHSVSCEQLELAVLAVLRALAATARWDVVCPATALDGGQERRREQQREKEAELARCRGLLAGLYEDLRDGVLTRQEYDSLKASYAGRCAALEQALAELLPQDAPAARERGEEGRPLTEVCKLERLDRRLTVCLVEQIHVYEGKRAEVRLSFRAPAPLPG